MTGFSAPQANASLDEEFTRNGELMSLRLIYLHMIEEYARHIGHAEFSASRSTARPANDLPVTRRRN
jgi:hypothetical protein